MNYKLNKRLLCAASFVERGASVADIGCDHAYLPIYLIKENIARSVVACDINEGPCETARDNIRRQGLSDVIAVRCTDGLAGIEDFAPDDIVICGMGGDLIFRIVSESGYTKFKNPLLILQPMTKVSELRSSLLRAGYNIEREALVYDDRLYEVIVCRYDGIKRAWSETELLTGRYLDKNDLYKAHIDKLIKQYMVIIEGKKKAGLDILKEEKLLEELQNEGNGII
ncbi:MAG: SAM-dependent methyltransferase [Clostridia bacterium]|nr:SAM-dependent methyltransferase [Clostridia bacterium]